MPHAFLSPSGAPAWVRCLAKPWREQGTPDSSSSFADEGTAAHFLLERCLLLGMAADAYLGDTIVVTSDGADWDHDAAQGPPRFPVDTEMAREVQKVLDVLRQLAGDEHIHPEQKLPIDHITGEEGATGTTDAVILKGTTLIVGDLKYGKGVQVFAEGNEQLLIYGAAALRAVDLLYEVQTIELHILQPRLNHFDSWVLTRAELEGHLAEVRAAANMIRGKLGPARPATPGDKQCRFCKAKATCPELRDQVMSSVAGEFVDLTKGEVQVTVVQAEKIIAQAFGVTPKAVDVGDDGNFVVMKPNVRPQLEAAAERVTDLVDQHLATCLDAADLVESWAKAVRAEVERRLLAGEFTDGRYKLVEGKKGARCWRDEAEAEAALKAMRLKVDQMYDLKVISPTSAEKLLAADNPRKWAKLQPLIGQSGGKPSVAPASDKRPALVIAAVANDFQDLSAVTADAEAFL